MCKYCEEIKEKGITEILNNIIEINNVPIMDVGIFMDDDCILELSGSTMDLTEIFSKKLKISYCPICGEKISKEES